jgi:Zn-dependent protease
MRWMSAHLLLYWLSMISGIDPILYVSAIVVTVLISITLHEAMHAFTAHWLGDDTAYLQGRLTLNPIKHIDPFLTIAMPVILALAGAPPLGAAKPVPFNPARLKYDEFGAALVGIAGPLTNLGLALVGALVARLLGFDALTLLQSQEVFVQILSTFIVVNLAFFIFNMIPFPPLDGSRVLYAIAPEPVQRIMAQIESFGLLGFVAFFFLLFRYIAPIMQNIILFLMNLLLGGL